MIQTFIKNYQANNLASKWKQTIKTRVITKNNYLVTGDIKEAKAFIANLKTYKPRRNFVSRVEHVIVTFEGLLVLPEPAYILVH